MALNIFYHGTTEVNLIITGPPETGKKSFIQALALTNNNLIIPEVTEDISSVYDLSFEVYGKTIMVNVWLVQNLEKSVDKIKLICLNKNSCSVVLFWYAIDAPETLKYLSKDYITMLRQRGKFHFLSLLVGNKADLRHGGARSCLQELQGEHIKTSFHLAGFVEGSNKIEQSVRNVFLKAVFIALGIEDD